MDENRKCTPGKPEMHSGQTPCQPDDPHYAPESGEPLLAKGDEETKEGPR